MLNDAEQQLLRETADAKLAKLDEDQLIDLHTRVRRARSKYVKLHRRRGAAKVAKDRSRTRADASVGRTAAKAEAFEDALARVSSRLATVAAQAADDLKRERLAAAAGAKGAKGTPARANARKGAPAGKAAAKPGAPRSRSRAPIDEKRNAAARSSKGRAQARRDAGSGGRARQ
jgi:hypothetical protein